MKILILHNKYLQKGGEDTVVNNEYNLLKTNGIEVKLLVFNNDRFTKKNRLKSILSLFHNHHSIAIIKSELLTFKPDVVHIHNVFYTITPGIINFLKKKNLPIVMTIHNYRLICPSTTLFFNQKIYEKNIHRFFPLHGIRNGVFHNSKLETLLLSLVIWGHRYLGTWKKVDKYIFLTAFAKRKFLKSSLQLPNSQLFVKPNFSRTPAKNNKEISGNTQFIFIGRLSEEKGIQTLLKSFTQNGLDLIIYGDGPLKPLVVEAANNNNHIEYKGFQSYDDFKDILKRSRALIFPSIWYEGMPMTILEALALGVPIITSSLGGMAEIIEHKKTGFLFEPNNAKALTIATKKMIELSAKEYKAMCVAAKTVFIKNYSEVTAFTNLMKVYTN